MESRDPGKQKTGRAQKLTEDTCGAAYSRSLACLDRNGYDKSKCEDVFDLYIQCKKRETETRLERRQEKAAK
ncbi:g12056 [Coccomyxa viridis]|uniref:G12056 protein n=1 Tax=Coccomyxa viridis TaxID=1274662 RepID=A0ABP1GE33_9CHLO